MFHGSAHIVYQRSNANREVNKLKIDRCQSKALEHDPFNLTFYCPKTLLPNITQNLFMPDMSDVDLYKKIGLHVVRYKNFHQKLSKLRASNLVGIWLFNNNSFTNYNIL